VLKRFLSSYQTSTSMASHSKATGVRITSESRREHPFP
jgi:hypothetical protein